MFSIDRRQRLYTKHTHTHTTRGVGTQGPLADNYERLKEEKVAEMVAMSNPINTLQTEPIRYKIKKNR